MVRHLAASGSRLGWMPHRVPVLLLGASCCGFELAHHCLQSAGAWDDSCGADGQEIGEGVMRNCQYVSTCFHTSAILASSAVASSCDASFGIDFAHTVGIALENFLD